MLGRAAACARVSGFGVEIASAGGLLRDLPSPPAVAPSKTNSDEILVGKDSEETQGCHSEMQEMACVRVPNSPPTTSDLNGLRTARKHAHALMTSLLTVS